MPPVNRMFILAPVTINKPLNGGTNPSPIASAPTSTNLYIVELSVSACIFLGIVLIFVSTLLFCSTYALANFAPCCRACHSMHVAVKHHPSYRPYLHRDNHCRISLIRKGQSHRLSRKRVQRSGIRTRISNQSLSSASGNPQLSEKAFYLLSDVSGDVSGPLHSSEALHPSVTPSEALDTATSETFGLSETLSQSTALGQPEVLPQSTTLGTSRSAISADPKSQTSQLSPLSKAQPPLTATRTSTVAHIAAEDASTPNHIDENSICLVTIRDDGTEECEIIDATIYEERERIENERQHARLHTTVPFDPSRSHIAPIVPRHTNLSKIVVKKKSNPITSLRHNTPLQKITITMALARQFVQFG